MCVHVGGLGRARGLVGSPAVLPAMSTDISVWLCCSLLLLKGHIAFLFVFYGFSLGNTIETCLNTGTPDGVGP